MTMRFPAERYLDCLGIGAVTPDADGLARLQSAQLHAFAFANLDSYLGATPSLDLAAILEKMIVDKRGGYCFEQNLLFDAALRHFGFDVTRIMARVRMGRPRGGARSHLAMKVAIGSDRCAGRQRFWRPGAQRGRCVFR